MSTAPVGLIENAIGKGISLVLLFLDVFVSLVFFLAAKFLGLFECFLLIFQGF